MTGCYYKVRQVLQSAKFMTKWDVTPVLEFNPHYGNSYWCVFYGGTDFEDFQHGFYKECLKKIKCYIDKVRNIIIANFLGNEFAKKIWKKFCVYCIFVCNCMKCFAMKYCLYPLDGENSLNASLPLQYSEAFFEEFKGR